MAESHAAKPAQAGSSASSSDAQLAGLPVDLSELPPELQERLKVRARLPGHRLAIGRYLITGELGRGGMGVVYDAWDPRIERRVAIKTIEPDLVPDEQEREEVIERFLREIKVVGKLHHPAIVTIFDYGEDPELKRGDDPYAPGRTYFYVMEYLEGQSLARVLRERGMLPDVEAVSIAVDVADALEIAHERGIIHRDIKPSNIFIRKNGQAVLLDFGIAKTQSPPLTRQGQILGTPTYLAPERLREKEIALDGRADIFSLGVLLYTMLAGEAPFAGDNVYELIDRIAKQSHAKLARSTPGGSALSKAIDRMLAKRPEDRYASAREVAFQLREARSLLTATTPDVSDLAGQMVPVREEMTDAATEVASASQPVPIPQIPDPPSGTQVDVELKRKTRPIPLNELNSAAPGATPSGVVEYDASYPSPKVYDPAELAGVQEEKPRLVPPTSPGPQQMAPPSASRSERPAPSSRSQELRAVQAPGSRSTERAAPTAAPSRSSERPAPAERVAPPRRKSSTGSADEDTVAEPEGLLGPGRSVQEAVRVRAAAPEHSEQVTELAEAHQRALPTLPSPPPVVTAGKRSKRHRIEASLVDEDEVIVKPAPLDSLKPDEVPTQAGVARPTGTPSGGTPVVKPYDPAETEIVRAKKGGDKGGGVGQDGVLVEASGMIMLREEPPTQDEPERRPEERRPEDRRPEDRRPEERRSEDRRPEDRREERPPERRPRGASSSSLKPPAAEAPPRSESRAPKSAAVARKTIGVGKSGGQRSAKPARSVSFSDIQIMGTDLDRPVDRARLIKKRVAILLAAGFGAVAIGLMLGRYRARGPTAILPNPPARAAGTGPAVVATPPSATSRTPDAPAKDGPSAEQLVKEGFAALDADRIDDADRLFARALAVAAAGSDAQVEATLGRGRAREKSRSFDAARELYEKVIEQRSTGPLYNEAREALDALDSAEDGEKRVIRKKPQAATPQPGAAPPVRAPAPSGSAPALPASTSPEDRCLQVTAKHIQNPPAAVSELEQLRRELPDAPCVFRQLGTFYERISEQRAAIAAYRHYLELSPTASDRRAIEVRIDKLAESLR